MSGRTLHWRDGKLITNRKTDRRQSARTPLHLMPEWVLSFELPGLLGLGLTPGPYPDIAGVVVTPPPGHIEVSGRNSEWVIGQAIEVLHKLAPRGVPNVIGMRLTRAAEQGPSVSGPLRRGDDRVIQVDWDGQRFAVIRKTSMRERSRPFKSGLARAEAERVFSPRRRALHG